MSISPSTEYPEVDAAASVHGFSPDALIEVLHAAAQTRGFLDRPVLLHIANILDLPQSLVFGVATFYHAFSLAPPRPHNCTVCTGTSCHLKGGSRILRELQEEFGAATDADASGIGVSIATVRCVGACGMAPLAVLDGRMLQVSDSATLAGEIRRISAGSGGEE